MAKRKCAVMVPSENTRSTNDPFVDAMVEKVIEPALSKFDLEVVTVSLPDGKGIDVEFVAAIDGAALCIADLTGRDAGVFYACGRRHALKKPLLLLTRTGTVPSFELPGVSVFPCDLSTPKGILTAIRTVSDMVRLQWDTICAESDSPAAISDLADAIGRIEKKLDSLAPTLHGAEESTVSQGSDWDALELQLMGPKAVHKLLAAGELDAAVEFVKKARHRFGMDSFLAVAVLPVMAGSSAGFEYLKSVAAEIIFSDNVVADDHVMLIIGALVQYFAVREDDTEGLKELGQIFVRARETFKDNNRLMGFLHIQLSKLQFNSGQIEDALKNLELASTRYGDSAAARHLEQVKKELQQ